MRVVDGLDSALAEPIRTFVDYKRALNRKYRPEAAALRLFDRYLCEHGATGWNSIDSVLIENFLRSRPRSRPRSYNHLLGVLHRFFEWAVVQGLVASNPVSATRRRDTGKRIPYLFDLNDAKRLLELARALPGPVSCPSSGADLRDDIRPPVRPWPACWRSGQAETGRCRFPAGHAVHSRHEIQ